MRGSKKPGTPPAITLPACHWLRAARASSVMANCDQKSPIPRPSVGETISQNSRSFATRFSFALPAIRALLMAPMEMPGAQGAAALQQQGNAAEFGGAGARRLRRGAKAGPLARLQGIQQGIVLVIHVQAPGR